MYIKLIILHYVVYVKLKHNIVSIVVQIILYIKLFYVRIYIELIILYVKLTIKIEITHRPAPTDPDFAM